MRYMERLRRELDLTGSLGLDFVNTVVPFRTGPIDLLSHPDAFTWWIAEAAPATLGALVPPDPAGRRLLTLEARDLREALVALFRAVADGSSSPPAPAAATIGRALRASPVTHRLDGLYVEVRYDASDPLALLTPIALSAAEVARSARPERLRPCAADGCRRWFVDTSKSGRRRWCSMERCGNRAKADRYRSRHAATD